MPPRCCMQLIQSVMLESVVLQVMLESVVLEGASKDAQTRASPFFTQAAAPKMVEVAKEFDWMIITGIQGTHLLRI